MDNGAGLAKYLCRVIDDSHAGIGISWRNVISTVSVALNENEKNTGIELEALGIGYDGNGNSEFLVHGVFDAEVPDEMKEVAFSRILERIKTDPHLRSLLIMISTEYYFTLNLIDFIFSEPEHVPNNLIGNPYLALVASDLFLEGKAVNDFVKNEAAKTEGNMEILLGLASKDWFLRLLEVLKPWNRGTSTGQFSFSSIQNDDRPVLDELLGLISDGTLPWLMLNRNFVMRQNSVADAFRRKHQADVREKQIRSLYYWLGIANDLILGVLFLAGSFEFFPGGNVQAGVVMFIVGSAQLVARSLIKIVMNLHVRSSRKKLQKIPN